MKTKGSLGENVVRKGDELRSGLRTSLPLPTSGAKPVNQWGHLTSTSLGNRPQKEDFSRRITALFAGMRRVGNWGQFSSWVTPPILL